MIHNTEVVQRQATVSCISYCSGVAAQWRFRTRKSLGSNIMVLKESLDGPFRCCLVSYTSVNHHAFFLTNDFFKMYLGLISGLVLKGNSITHQWGTGYQMVFVTLCPHCLKIVIISSLELLNKTSEVCFGFFAIWGSAMSSSWTNGFQFQGGGEKPAVFYQLTYILFPFTWSHLSLWVVLVLFHF